VRTKNIDDHCHYLKIQIKKLNLTIVEPIDLYQSTENSLYCPANIGKFGILILKFKLTHRIITPYTMMLNLILQTYSVNKLNYKHLYHT
jgi:hypothetical protein